MARQPCTGKLAKGLFTRAAEGGYIDCAKILLDSNADIDALNFSGQTPLHVVSWTDSSLVVCRETRLRVWPFPASEQSSQELPKRLHEVSLLPQADGEA